jgi:nucleoside-diphosphate-sugar epimerase
MSSEPHRPTYSSSRLRILVTGASGFIGRAFVTRLALSGHEVVGLARTEFQADTARAVVVPDYDDTANLARLAQGMDTVVHLAAVAHQSTTGSATEIERLFAPNVRAVSSMAQASATAGVRRFILVSSIGVNGNCTAGAPFTEDDAPRPAEPYAISKWQCELALREVADQNPSMDFVIIRPPLVYGPRAPGNFGRLLHAVAGRKWLPLGQVTSQRSFIGLDNLLDFIELCALHPDARNQLYLISDGEDVSTAEFIRRIGQALGTPARLLSIPLSPVHLLARLAGRGAQIERLVASLQIDSGKARRQLGWTPPLSLDEGLRRAAAGMVLTEPTP